MVHTIDSTAIKTVLNDTDLLYGQNFIDEKK